LLKQSNKDLKNRQMGHATQPLNTESAFVWPTNQQRKVLYYLLAFFGGKSMFCIEQITTLNCCLKCKFKKKKSKAVPLTAMVNLHISLSVHSHSHFVTFLDVSTW